jgi:hypothetical protein
MSRNELEPLAPELQALLACEREIAPQPEEVRERALLRARAVLRASPRQPRARAPVGGARWLIAAALVLMAATLFGAAMRAKRAAARSALGAVPTRVAHSNPPRKPPTASIGLPASASASVPELGAATTSAEPSNALGRAALAPRPATPQEAYALELKLLSPARAAVARADFAGALAAVGEHERHFPAGRLAEEREALRVQALSGLHRTNDARRAAAAFRARFPGSILLSRMTPQALGTP